MRRSNRVGWLSEARVVVVGCALPSVYSVHISEFLAIVSRERGYQIQWERCISSGGFILLATSCSSTYGHRNTITCGRSAM